MNNISELIISAEEAESALKAMRHCDIDAHEALETIDEFIVRRRNVTTAKLIDEIIKNRLTENQAKVLRMHWYDGMNTPQIGNELNISQSLAYITLSRANEIVKAYLSPLISYQNDIIESTVEPLHFKREMEIAGALKNNSDDFFTALKNLRLQNGIEQKKLATLLKVSLNELKKIEQGCAVPSVSTAIRYSALFDTSISMNFKNGRGVYTCHQH